MNPLKNMWKKMWKNVQKGVALAAIATAVAIPSSVLAGPPTPIDTKQVEATVLTAQGQIVSGKLDDGLGNLATIKKQIVTTDLEGRVSFVVKLAEVRMAEMLGDQAKVLAALNAAFQEAKQPDQIQAVWQVGLSVTHAAIANKDCASPIPLIDFLARGPGASMKQFSTTLEVARLRVAAGNVGAAEADLRNAARQAQTASDWATWIGVVNYLAGTVDGGQSPQAGADVFTRLRECAKPVRAGMDLAQGRYMLQRGLEDGVEAMVEQGVAEATTDADLLTALSLQFDLAITLIRIEGKADLTQVAIAKAENLAAAVPADAAVANIRGNAFMALQQPNKAADVFWAAAQIVKTPHEQEQMLTNFGTSMVAAGNSADLAARLQAAEATPIVYVAVAGAMVNRGDSLGALRLLGTVPAQKFAEDARAVANVKPLMDSIMNQRQEIARNQGERTRAIASALDAAAKETKDPQAAEALATQAAAMSNLASQVEK